MTAKTGWLTLPERGAAPCGASRTVPSLLPKLMRILLVVHIGETLGHLVRALTVADELHQRGCTIHITAAGRAADVVAAHNPLFRFHPVDWQWSHNSHSPSRLIPKLLNSIFRSGHAISDVMTSVRPDLVLGFPGVVSGYAARRLKVPHASVMHAPYLAPLWNVTDPAPEEEAIIAFSRRMCKIADRTAWALLTVLGQRRLRYSEFLQTERIFVPQPGLQLSSANPNIKVVSFIRGSIGPSLDELDIPVEDSCYVTFGSGNPCDIVPLVRAAAEVFEHVIVTYGSQKLGFESSRVTARPLLSSASLAGRVKAVVSHGGLGTVGTFAAFGTPQLIIPTELDQATTAMYSRRAGIARTLGLETWTRRKRLGRRLPMFDANAVRDKLLGLHASGKGKTVATSGAAEIADGIMQGGAFHCV